jgi:hypothetical protein
LTGVFVGVDVFTGRLDAVGVFVRVAVLVCVGEGPMVGVLLGVLVGVFVRVAVGVPVAVGVAVLVGVLVCPEAKVNTSWGGELPSREVKDTPSVLSGWSTKL